MIRIGKILDSRIKDGYRRIKYLLNGRSDTRETIQAQPFGIDSNPVEGAECLHFCTGINGEAVNMGQCDKTHRKALKGEMRLFAIDENGNQIGELYLTNDGFLKLMEGTDNAVRYSALETAFNQLKDDYNDLSTKWSAFATAYVPGGPAFQGTPPTASTSSPNTSDITAAKVDEINLP